MKRKFPNLCSPIKIGQVEFKNRMFSAPVRGTDITILDVLEENR